MSLGGLTGIAGAIPFFMAARGEQGTCRWLVAMPAIYILKKQELPVSLFGIKISCITGISVIEVDERPRRSQKGLDKALPCPRRAGDGRGCRSSPSGGFELAVAPSLALSFSTGPGMRFDQEDPEDPVKSAVRKLQKHQER
jgi:hypothetical protein